MLRRTIGLPYWRGMIALAGCFWNSLGSSAAETDWPQWRGTQRDGVVSGAKLPAKWPEKLSKGWSVEVGEGHATPLVVGNRVFVFARRDDQEVLCCFDLATGKELWATKNPAPYEMHSAATAHGKGPKSTPVYHDGKVITLGISGILSCVNASDGKVLWRKDFSNEFMATSPLYGTAMSPLVTDGMVIAHVGGHDKGALNAFDIQDGKVLWTATQDGPGYASPILATVGGKPILLTQTQNHLVAVDPMTGKLLWKESFTTPYDQNSVTPVVHQDILFYSGETKPLVALRIGEKTKKELWSNKKLPLYMSTPIVYKDRLIGLTHLQSGKLFAVSVMTGKLIWESDGRIGENVALVRANGTVFALTNEARLIIFDANASTFKPLAEYKRLSESQTWAHPVIVGNQILIKDKTHLTVWKWDE